MTILKLTDSLTLLKNWDHPGLDFRQLLDNQTSQTIVREALAAIVESVREPSALLAPLLFSPVELSPSYPIIKFPVDQPVFANSISEGSEAGEVEIGTPEVLWRAGMSKVGMQVKMSEEVLRSDSKGLLRRAAQLGGLALQRKKETLAVEALTNHGVTRLDPQDNSIKSPTGRDSAGAYNSSLVPGDLVDVIDAMLVNGGFQANTFIVHPRMALALLRNQDWREFWQLGGQSWDGENTSSIAVVPAQIPWAWKFVTSPFVPLSSIYVVDSRYTGETFVDQRVAVQEWDDPSRDLHRMKLTESYNLSVANDGLPVAVLKNLSLEPSFDFAANSVVAVAPTDSLTGDFGFSGVVS